MGVVCCSLLPVSLVAAPAPALEQLLKLLDHPCLPHDPQVSVLAQSGGGPHLERSAIRCRTLRALLASIHRAGLRLEGQAAAQHKLQDDTQHLPSGRAEGGGGRVSNESFGAGCCTGLMQGVP